MAVPIRQPAHGQLSQEGTDAEGPSESQLSSPASTDPDESVGRDNVGGYNGALSHQQANNIIKLWSALSDFDKKPITFSPRHQDRLTKGRFKQPKKATTVPGVDSTKRSFLGQNSGPASWPDANRYMEALIVKLCASHPSPVKKDRQTIQRWSLIIASYKKIRDTVLGNAKVMSETKIQLAEINNKTLVAWYNNRSKTQERDVLKQGLAAPIPVPSDPQPLPQPKDLPERLDTGKEDQQHQFLLPKNTAGTAKVRRRHQLFPKPSTEPSPQPPLPPPVVRQAMPFPVQPYVVMANLPAAAGPFSVPVPLAVPAVKPVLPSFSSAVQVPRSTQSWRKKREQEQGGIPSKRYKPRTGGRGAPTILRAQVLPKHRNCVVR